MASLQEIKRHIDSTKKTSQITSAMQMISTSKLNQIQRHTKTYETYANQVQTVISHLAQAHAFDENATELPLVKQRPIKKSAVLVVTSDRGLVGGYNHNVLKATDELLAKHQLNSKNAVIIAVGGHGSDYYAARDYQILYEYREIRDIPTFFEAREIVDAVTDHYAKGDYDELYVTYNHYVNRIRNEFASERLLPISGENFEIETEASQKALNVEYDFEPNGEELLKAVLPQYAQSRVYGAILDAKTAEHSASVTAMSSATDNAKEAIDHLDLMFNRARQAAITTEITEITGGMAAQE